MTRHAILAGSISLFLLAACAKEDPTPRLPESKTYSGLKALDLTFNGSGMAGKRIAVDPSGTTATLSLDGIFDISSLSESLKGMSPLAAPGVLPGSPSLSIPVELKAQKGKWSFSGSGETDFVTYSYSGSFDSSTMKMDLKEVQLKDQSMAGGVWKPAPVKKGDSPLVYESQPFRLIWDIELPIEIPGLENGIGEILDLLVNIPFIPVYNNTASMSLTQVIANGLRSVAFNPDGNLVVTYLQTANGSSTFAHAPLSTFQYVPAGSDMIKLYVNPTDILTLVLLNNTNKGPDIPEHPFGKETRAATDDPGASILGSLKPETLILLAKTLTDLSAQCAAGIPVHAVKSQTGDMAFYIGRDVIIPLMTNVLIPLVQNEDIQQLIVNYIDSNPALAPHAEEIILLIEAFPLLLQQTTDIQLGLNLVPYAG